MNLAKDGEAKTFSIIKQSPEGNKKRNNRNGFGGCQVEKTDCPAAKDQRNYTTKSNRNEEQKEERERERESIGREPRHGGLAFFPWGILLFANLPFCSTD